MAKTKIVAEGLKRAAKAIGKKTQTKKEASLYWRHEEELYP